jgi:acetyl esterase
MAPPFEFESFTVIAVYRPRASAGGRREERYGQSQSNNGQDVRGGSRFFAEGSMSVMSREMRIILDAYLASAGADWAAMDIHEARSAFATGAAGWNVPLPDLDSENVMLGGVPCRLLVPAFRKEGTVVFVHGGGWTLGSPATHERFARLLAIYSATTVVVPDYRLAPESPCPAAIEDVAKIVQAIDSVRDAGGPLVLCGDSAGATIALATALAHRPSNLVALSLLYGCFEPSFYTNSHQRNGDGRYGLSTEKMRWYWSNWLGDAHDSRAAPLNADLTGLPWTYLLGAGLDPLCDDTVNLTRQLVAYGVECRADYVPGVVHGFLQMTAKLPEAESALRTLSQVIRDRLDKAG